MKFSPEQYAKALYDALADVRPSDQDKVLDTFVSVLREQGHLGLIDQIEKEFIKIEQKATGKVPTTVTVAREGMHERKMIEQLNELIGGTPVIKKQVDESVLGGVVIETEDMRIDASVRGQLDQLKKNLSN